MTTKLVEKAAFEYLKVYIEEHLPGSTLRDTMNKGSLEANPNVADAVLEFEGRFHHIEIKSSTKHGDYNVRFSHQTMTKAINKDVIVAFITNLQSGSPNFEFFRLADIAPKLRIEPIFFIARKNTTENRKPLTDLLSRPDGAVNVTRLLDSTIRSHINPKYLVGEVALVSSKTDEQLATDAPLWSPFEDDYDIDGACYPPWLKYPNIPIDSVGWRMGDGEDYRTDFGHWLRSLSPENLAAFEAKYPTPHEWLHVWPRS